MTSRDTPIDLASAGAIQHALNPGGEGLAGGLGLSRVPRQAFLGQPQLVPLGLGMLYWGPASWALFHWLIFCPYK